MLSPAGFPIVLLSSLSALVYLFIYFCVSPPPPSPPCLHHMVADQIMSNILPLQVFAICSFQMWDLLKAGVIMGMLYPPSLLSHHISLQLMLQREFHVITLALLSCPHEREGEADRRTEEATEGGGWGWGRKEEREGEKQLKTGMGCHDGPVLCGHVNVACQLNGAERGTMWLAVGRVHAKLVYHCCRAQSNWCQQDRGCVDSCNYPSPWWSLLARRGWPTEAPPPDSL